MASNNPRPFEEIVADIQMFQQADEIRRWLLDISGLHPRLDCQPNPYYGCTQDGLVLIEYYGGPSAIGTPFGMWCLSGGGTTTAGWFDEARDRLGLITVMPAVQEENGDYGPVHAITKGLDSKQLQSAVWNFRGIGIGLLSASAVSELPLSEARQRLEKLRDHFPEELSTCNSSEALIRYYLSDLTWSVRIAPHLKEI